MTRTMTLEQVKRLKFHKNKIKFNCTTYRGFNAVQPPHCYNCVFRNGYPQNLGGDSNCKNFVQACEAVLKQKEAK